MGRSWEKAAALLMLAGVLLGGIPPAVSESILPPDLGVIARLCPTPEALSAFLQREMTFREDLELFGKKDYWQAPVEFLERRMGDCEDYALLAEEVLRRGGLEAFTFSLYGPGYAHTVCVFQEGGQYHILNQDKVIRCRATTLEEVASFLCAGWDWGAIARRFGHRGRAVRRINKPVAFSTPLRYNVN